MDFANSALMLGVETDECKGCYRCAQHGSSTFT